MIQLWNKWAWKLFRYELGPGVIDEIRKSTTVNFILGASRFAEQIETELGRRLLRVSLGDQSINKSDTLKPWSVPVSS